MVTGFGWHCFLITGNKVNSYSSSCCLLPDYFSRYDGLDTTTDTVDASSTVISAGLGVLATLLLDMHLSFVLDQMLLLVLLALAVL